MAPPPPPERAGFGVAVTETDLALVPPGPVQLKVYAVVAVSTTDSLLAVTTLFPVQLSPLAVHVSAPEALQLSSIKSPVTAVDTFADSVTTVSYTHLTLPTILRV